MIALASLIAALAVGGNPGHQHHHGGVRSWGRHEPPYAGAAVPGSYTTPPDPGGPGFPNGAPDGYGYMDFGTYLPLGADRTPEYFFRRQYATFAEQVFFPSYYNPYLQRGQRYIPYAGCGGAHPMGGPPIGPAWTSIHPSREAATTPAVEPPVFGGEADGSIPAPGPRGLIP